MIIFPSVILKTSIPERRVAVVFGVAMACLFQACLVGSLAAQTHLTMLSDDGCGRATAYSKTNKIVTVDETTHVAWLDSDDSGFRVKIRSLNQSTMAWSDTFDVGAAFDNHGGPSLASDRDGFLHIVYGPHHGPMIHRRSTRPNDASEWGEATEFGNRLTYPTLVVAPDNTLLVICRQSFDDRSKPWCVVLHSKKPGDHWSSPTQLLTGGQAGYSQFHVSAAWGPEHKALHLATRMYGDNPRWGYKVGYMKSNDFGTTWLTSQGEPIPLPANRTTIGTIHQTPANQRQQHASGSALAGGLIAVDAENTPHVLFHSLTPAGTLPHQAWIATPDAQGSWKKVKLNPRIPTCPDDASLGTPGGFSIADDGSWNLALTMTREPESAESPFGSGHNEVVWAQSTDRGKSFESRLISEPNDSVPNWLPNIERSTGFNSVQNPAVIFTSGPKGASLKDRLHNRVYWFRPEN